jgi:hypothetical protein
MRDCGTICTCVIEKTITRFLQRNMAQIHTPSSSTWILKINYYTLLYDHFITYLILDNVW